MDLGKLWMGGNRRTWRGCKREEPWNGTGHKEKSAKSALHHPGTISRGHVLMSWVWRRERRKRTRTRARKKFRMGMGAKGKEEKYNVTLSGPGAGCKGNQRHLWGAGRWQRKCWKSSVHDYKKWRNLLSLSSWKPTPGLLWKSCPTITDDTDRKGGCRWWWGDGEVEGKETHP